MASECFQVRDVWGRVIESTNDEQRFRNRQTAQWMISAHNLSFIEHAEKVMREVGWRHDGIDALENGYLEFEPIDPAAPPYVFARVGHGQIQWCVSGSDPEFIVGTVETLARLVRERRPQSVAE